MEQLIDAASRGRHGIRDACMVRLAWGHGLRVSELVGLQLTDINLETRQIYCRRAKGSLSGHHDLLDEEIKPLKRWLSCRAKCKGAKSPYLFISERSDYFHRIAFNCLLRDIGKRAGFTFRCYPHILRHSCGYHLADKGTDAFRIALYLGHKNIQNSLNYVHTSAAQIRGIW